MTKLFLNLDLETTGLDPDKDHILEVAWDILDEELVSVMTAPRSFIVEHGDSWGDVWNALRSAPTVVRKMHTESGLVSDMVSFDSDAETLFDIADILYGDLRWTHSELPPETTIHFIGFSPAFDRSFLAAKSATQSIVSETKGRMHHRLFDLSSFKIGYELAGVEIPKIKNPNPHRALSDIGEVAEFGRLVLRDLKGETL